MHGFAQQEDVGEVAVRPVDELMQEAAEHKGCGTHGGSGKASCGSGAGQNDLAPEI
jgi:nitrogen fixation protein NifB